MKRCQKCNNELVADARFCNICGTSTQSVPAVSVGLKRTIQPNIRHIPPSREIENQKAASQGGIQPAGNTERSTATEGPAQVVPQKDAPGASPAHVPGIIRPIMPPSSPRQNVPGPKPPNSISPLPAVPVTPPLPKERLAHPGSVQNVKPPVTPAPVVPVQSNQNRVERPHGENPAASQTVQPVKPVQPVQPPPVIRQNVDQRQPAFSPQTQAIPSTALHEMPVNYSQTHNSNSANGASHRQDLPLFSPESFAYTTHAAEHWRNSWRDRQDAEAGPAETVSKGQASVAAPLAARQNSFMRMRAIRSRQEAGETHFGFWITLFLMICLAGGLTAYIVYSYLPGSFPGTARTSQPAGTQQPSFTIAGSSTFTSGQSMLTHGQGFGANDPISFSLDTLAPVLNTNGQALTVQSDSHGAFDVTIVISKDWPVGARIIQASDSRANLSAYLDIEVNPGGTPLTSSANLHITQNGQPLSLLSFSDQIGQPAPAPQSFSITNTSASPLQWSASVSTTHNLNWLSIVDNDYSGQLAIQQPHSLGISVNTAGLSATQKGKPYTGQILFIINGNEQLTLPVQLTIIDATSEMVFSPDPIIATAIPGGACQTGATLTLINLGATVITWSATPDQNAQGKIQFIDNFGNVTKGGQLEPSGMNKDTAVVTLRCIGVQAGDKYHISVYANSTPFSDFVIIQ